VSVRELSTQLSESRSRQAREGGVRKGGVREV